MSDEGFGKVFIVIKDENIKDADVLLGREQQGAQQVLWGGLGGREGSPFWCEAQLRVSDRKTCEQLGSSDG